MLKKGSGFLLVALVFLLLPLTVFGQYKLDGYVFMDGNYSFFRFNRGIYPTEDGVL